MTKFSIDVPAGAAFQFDAAAIPAEKRDYIINGLVEYALNVVAQRATAGKGDLTDSGKRALIMDKLQRLQNGTYIFGAGAGPADPVTVELRSMAEAKAREANWKLTAAREFMREHGPIMAYVAAAMIQKGLVDAGKLDVKTIGEVADKNEQTLLNKARENIAAKTAEISL